MEVRSGLDPKNQDEDVRFRTTYYFRTFDYCYGKAKLDSKQAELIIPETDALYRFRMTGKAHSLTTKVRFESGSLRNWQIDPFGATVVYDDKLKQHRFRTQVEAKEELAKEAALSDFKELFEVYKTVKDESGLQTTKSKLDEAMSIKLAQFTGKNLSPTPSTDQILAAGAEQTLTQAKGVGQASGAQQVSNNAALAAKAAPFPGQSRNLQCPKDAPVHRGFQILGPEGWRTFDQDERLIMAMTSSAQPLVGALKEFSDRVLNAKSSSDEILLPLVREDLRISRTHRVLDRLEKDPPDSATVFKDAISTFEDREP